MATQIPMALLCAVNSFEACQLVHDTICSRRTTFQLWRLLL